jgi:hypothetical protein
VPGAKTIVILSTILSSVIFLLLTYDSLKQMSRRTNEDKLTASAAEGKWVWQKYNCNDCHTILGIGVRTQRYPMLLDLTHNAWNGLPNIDS